MKKGFWIAMVSITDPEAFKAYVGAYDEAFRKSMLDYAGLLESWRWDSMMKIRRLAQPAAMTSHEPAALN